jgi:hypothetical protein
MADPKSDSGRDQKFWRGLFFVSAGVFLLVRFAAQGDNAFFVGTMWLTATVALVALGIFLWTTYSNNG